MDFTPNSSPSPYFFKSRKSKIITSLPEFLIRRIDTEAGEVPYAGMHCSRNQAVLLAPELEKPSFRQTCVTAEACLMIGHLTSLSKWILWCSTTYELQLVQSILASYFHRIFRNLAFLRNFHFCV